MSKKTRNIIIAVAVLLVLVIGTFVAYKNLAPQPVTGDKTIVFEVTHVDGTQKNLRGALEQEGLISGDESEYGLYVTTVDGETADSNLNQWWCFTKDGEMLMTGVDDTMIADGEHYETFIDIY